MNLEVKKFSVEDIQRETNANQSAASHPLNSAWVNANAGTGKTHVLTLRVLRLLLAGTRPERILCLTFTKAAAAEMSKRVFDRLAGWVTAEDKALRKDLAEVTGETVPDSLMARARTLFAHAIETPGGLKVQTIHAFAERLLQRFPLEAGVPPDFKILDDVAAGDLKADAIEATLTLATSNPNSPLGQALNVIIRYAADSQFDQLISKAVEERKWLEATAHISPRDVVEELSLMDTLLRQHLKVRAAVAVADIHRECADVLSESELRELHELLNSGKGKADADHRTKIAAALNETDHRRKADKLSDYFLTDKGEALRKSLMTKALSDEKPGLHGRCQQAQQNFFNLTRELRALTLVEASLALYRIAGDVLRRYAAARSSAGALDFDDLILKTRDLLTGDSGQAQWVLFKLDGGLDHILVDEAQDTSPEQWEIVSGLAREFFSDAGAGTLTRTLFAVGDEKQSIYSFQGAAPKKFADMGRRFAALATQAQRTWKRVPLTLSFRTVKPVLDAVDQVFSDIKRTPGLMANEGIITHVANRVGHAGLVEIWDTEKSDDATGANPWQPLSDGKEQSPANRLADRIADTIHSWLKSGERLLSENRPITPGDVLILVRKRHPFAVPMVAALKRRGIAVAGSDRIKLIEQIAVQDLMVLGDFLTLPEDDLALATVLKSPLFDLDDHDLLDIAYDRKQKTLWKALIDKAATKSEYAFAAETLKRWRAKADFTPPFEFYSAVLERDGMRARMLNRLGPEAADIIDEFLDLALAYDESNPPSLTQFLSKLRAANPEVKRDMDHGRDEVRVMTVHGAKGLEAPIVFLPDTCTTASGEDATSRLVKLGDIPRPSGLAEPIVWAVKGTSKVPAVADARAHKEALDTQERNRLLYVAMTRARDRLYIAGFEGKRGKGSGCWYEIVSDALTPHMTEIVGNDGQKIWRKETPQIAAPEKPKHEKGVGSEILARPAFAAERAAAEPKLSVPLAPSRLEPYAPDAEGEPAAPPKRDAAITNDSPSPLSVGGPNRFLRGTITHALLQHLPSVDEGRRQEIAEAFVERRGAVLPEKVRISIVRETLAVLRDSAFAAIFGPQSVAEAPLAAVIPRPSGTGPALDLSGQIDRIAITDREVLIVDYKTNRPPPAAVDQVADAYLFQLAAYRLALHEIYPGKTVRAALLWTDGPRLMEVPPDMLDAYTARLWDLNLGSLDAV